MLDANAESLTKIKTLVEKCYAAKAKADEAEKEYKELKQELASLMSTTNTDKFIADSCTASCKLKTSVSVPKDIEDKEALFDYIKSNYGEEVLKEMITINARTFSSWYDKEVEKKMLEGDIDFKLDMLKPYEYYSVGFRKR